MYFGLTQHHEFPQDYRNGINSYDYDPTKWLINLLNRWRLTFNLVRVPRDEISKGRHV
jgi:stearoyl-CoA desaturase (delta-9 desaturase)